MAHYEPGEEFEVEYGRGHKVKVKALGLRDKRTAYSHYETFKSAGGNISEAYAALESLMRMMVVDCQDEFVNSLDESLAMEIAGKVFQAARLSDDEQKK